ncbi:hypothetical protein CD29_06270 [Ureibacillus manganicus DSM 26584]|uniref:Uncharacterized protein n=1 Tax=Ureibacillus manganicus DSM 26584 TaxID=1384049 RepID=A0A0A3I736_9BACL|nr:hypothetical protein CD29_06270 [Ureibacillus manganicus DSM 26584]
MINSRNHYLEKVTVRIPILQVVEVIPIKINIMATNTTKENVEVLVPDSSVLEVAVSSVAKNVK